LPTTRETSKNRCLRFREKTQKTIDKPTLNSLSLATKPTGMIVVSKALLHKVNGTTIKSELPELKGRKFQTDKEKQKFKREYLKELFGDRSEFLEDDFKRADIILETVTLPPGVEELPEGWRPDPITDNIPTVRDIPVTAEPVWRTPKFKTR
jgi:hypothetical protein